MRHLRALGLRCRHARMPFGQVKEALARFSLGALLPCGR
jgi:hypothetical protein